MSMSVRALQEVGKRPTGQGPCVVHAKDAGMVPQCASCTDGDEDTLVCILSMQWTSRKQREI